MIRRTAGNGPGQCNGGHPIRHLLISFTNDPEARSHGLDRPADAGSDDVRSRSGAERTHGSGTMNRCLAGTFCLLLASTGLARSAINGSPPPSEGHPTEHTANASNVLDVDCTGSAPADTAAMSAALGAGAASSYTGTVVRVHGQCQVDATLTGTFSKSLAIAGDGPEVTTFTFTNATDGFDFKLIPMKAAWPSFSASGFSIIRGPTSPAIGNSALSVIATSTPTGAGAATFRDITIRGSSTYSSEWRTGLVAGTLSVPEFQNIRILGINATGTERGDVGMLIKGEGQNTFGVGYLVDGDSLIQGYSTGALIVGPVQGVTFAPGVGIIGDNFGIKALGSGAPANHVTVGDTAAGATTVQFAPGSLKGIEPISVINLSGLPPNDNIISASDDTGRVTVSLPATGPVTPGAVATIAPYYSMEEVVANGVSFNAATSCFYASAVSQPAVTGASTCLRFGTASAFAGVDFEDSSYGFVGSGTSFFGANTGGNEHAVVINSQGYIGRVGPMVLSDIMGSSFSGSFIKLAGTSQNVVLRNINCNGCFDRLVDNSANPAKNSMALTRRNGRADTPSVLAVSELPPCDAETKGARYDVSDAMRPDWNGRLIGGGSTAVEALCDGSAWTAH
jgi:hypothetical protein